MRFPVTEEHADYTTYIQLDVVSMGSIRQTYVMLDMLNRACQLELHSKLKAI